MPATTPVKILVVDDLPERLLVYQTVLDEPDYEVICARGGAEALQRVLHNDFAVILLDVNMPGMSGFETAALIRRRKRSAHTPIIFVTAFADELHAIEGYSYGAVDFILSPVIPDILRTKVRVFVQLFRLNQQVRRQAAREVARAELEHARLAQVLETASDLFAQTDAHGRISHINRAGRRILGLDDGEDIRGRLSLLEIQLAGDPAGHGHLATSKPGLSSAASWANLLDKAAREGVVFGESSILAGNGREIHFSHVLLAHYKEEPSVLSASAEKGASNDACASEKPKQREVEAFSFIARDVSDRKRAEQALARHRAHLEQLVNERTAELEASQERLRVADRLASIGTLAAGLGHDMGNLLLPVQLRMESLERALRNAQQISPTASLYELVMGDVEAVKTSCEYLQRLSQGLRQFAAGPDDDELAPSSTDLSAWWPRLEPFLRAALPSGVALRQHRLNHLGLPENQQSGGGSANPWKDLPAVSMPTQRLTQAVFNLVQNAGDALRERGRGVVRIGAGVVDHAIARANVGDTALVRESSDAHQCLVISVSDDGPGMPDSVRRRCMEPFFTTKARGISTGLGLALVHGTVTMAGGAIDLDTSPDRGTTFRLWLPIAAAEPCQSATRTPLNPNTTSATHDGAVLVQLGDMRLNAYVTALVRSARREVRSFKFDGALLDDTVGVVILDHTAADSIAAQLRSFLSANPNRCAIIVGDSATAFELDNVVTLPASVRPAQLRTTLKSALDRRHGAHFIEPNRGSVSVNVGVSHNSSSEEFKSSAIQRLPAQPMQEAST